MALGEDVVGDEGLQVQGLVDPRWLALWGFLLHHLSLDLILLGR